MAVYLPGLLILAAPSAVAARRSLPAAVVVAVVAGMVLLIQKTSNWNSGGLGLMRYAVWMVPPLAWLAAEGVAAYPRFGRRALIASVVVHGLIVAAAWPGRLDYLKPTRPARWVWSHAPQLYSPDPQLFAVRTLGVEGAFEPGWLPLAYVDRRGRVTKLLIDPAAVARLPVRFHVEPAYLERVRADAAGRRGLYYLHPPTGAVRLWPGDAGRPF